MSELIYYCVTDREHYECGGVDLYADQETARVHFGSRFEPMEIVTVPRAEWERMRDVVREFLAEKEHFRAYPEIWKNKYADIEELLK